jgi:hypothetical protein
MMDLPDRLDVLWLKERSLREKREMLKGRLEVCRKARYKGEGPSDDEALIEATLIDVIDALEAR